MYTRPDYHVKLLDFVVKLDEKDLNEYFQKELSERKVDFLLRRLADLNGVVLKLQIYDYTLHQAWAYLNSVLKAYLSSQSDLLPKHALYIVRVLNPAFSKYRRKPNESVLCREEVIKKDIDIQ